MIELACLIFGNKALHHNIIVSHSIFGGQPTFSITCGNAFRGMGSTRGRFLALLSYYQYTHAAHKYNLATLAEMLMVQRLLLRPHLLNLEGLRWAH